MANYTQTESQRTITWMEMTPPVSSVAGCTQELLDRCRAPSAVSWRRRRSRLGRSRGAGNLDPVLDDWRSLRLAAEFHGADSDAFFLEAVLPSLPALRSLYAAHNGSFAAATLLREPIDYLFSAYRMWPPRTAPSAPSSAADASASSLRVTPFPTWVADASGLQAGSLVAPLCTRSSPQRGVYHQGGDACVAPRASIAGTPPGAGGERLVRRSRAALAQFDWVRGTLRPPACNLLRR